MPDLITEYFWHCLTAENWQTQVLGSKGDLYTVTWGRGHKHLANVQYDWSCTCKGYSMRKGYCSHIKKVIAAKLHCGWMQYTDGGGIKDHKCPMCRGPVASMGWAV